MATGLKRREFIALCAAVTSWPLSVGAQPLPVIGFLSSRSSGESAPLVSAFRQGLSDGGYVEARDVVIVYQWAENKYDRLPGMAAELVRMPASMIVAAGGAVSAFAAKAATTVIPIVFTSVGNPVEIGLVASLARPGGNVTGIDATLTAELDAKRLELLHELLPSTEVIGVLVNPNRPDLATQVSEVHAAAQKLGLRLLVLGAGSESELDTAFKAATEQRLGALLVGADPFFVSRREQLIASAAHHRIPVMYQWRDFPLSGGLISYGASLAEAYRQTGVYAGRILKGAKPADLPVQRAARFELVLNLRIARNLGLAVPQALLARADEVIE